MSVLQIFILLILCIIVLPINMKFFASYDLRTNIGSIYFNLLKLKLFYGKFFLKNKSINIVNKNLNHTTIPLAYDDNFKDYTDATLIIFRKTDFKKIKITFKFGIKNEPFASTMVILSAKTILNTMLSVFKSIKSRTKVESEEECYYEENMIIADFKCYVSISIFDYIWGILESRIQSIKSGEKLRWKKEKTA